MAVYKTWNGAMPTTAAQVAVTTGTTVKTMLQLATPATRDITILSWGYSFDDTPGADGVIELIQTDVAATVTAHVAAGVQPQNPGSPASLLTLSTTGTGYTGTAEGSITATRVLDCVGFGETATQNGSTCEYRYQFMPDERPVIPVSKFLRVRATVPTTAVDLRCWIVWDE